jgi:uncharacterized Zn-finger protein
MPDAHRQSSIVEGEPVPPYFRPGLVRLACWLAILLRIFLVVALLSTVLLVINHPVWATWYLAQLSVVVVVWLAYFAVVAIVRCPGCRSRFLLESWRRKHPDARKLGHADHQGTAILDALREQHITCMYCGRRWRLG